MTGVWGGLSGEAEDSSSDSQEPGPGDALTVDVCRLNFHVLHALHTARLVFRSNGWERSNMWEIMIHILICVDNKSKVISASEDKLDL